MRCCGQPVRIGEGGHIGPPLHMHSATPAAVMSRDPLEVR